MDNDNKPETTDEKDQIDLRVENDNQEVSKMEKETFQINDENNELYKSSGICSLTDELLMGSQTADFVENTCLMSENFDSDNKELIVDNFDVTSLNKPSNNDTKSDSIESVDEVDSKTNDVKRGPSLHHMTSTRVKAPKRNKPSQKFLKESKTIAETMKEVSEDESEQGEDEEKFDNSHEVRML